MRRRVGAPSQISEAQYSDPEILKGLLNLADIGALSGAQAPTAPMDLMGASQDPQQFQEIAGVQQYETPQPPTEKDYLKTLRQISQLPLAMSDSDELRQDALENLDSYDKPESPLQQNPNPMQNKQHRSLDPNDMMSHLSRMPAYQQDSDFEREEAFRNMEENGIPERMETPPETVKNKVPLDPNDVMTQLASLPAYQRDSDFEREEALQNMEENGIPERMEAPAPDLDPNDPNDVISQLASLPAYQRDSDFEREEAMQGMRDKAQRNEQFSTDGLPRDKAGKLKDPLDQIREMVAQDPTLLDQLPEETRAMLAQKDADPNKPFVSPPQEVSEGKIIPKDQTISAQDVESHPQQTVKEGAVEQGMQDPLIIEDLERLNGLKQIPAEDLERAAQWQNALTKKMDQLDAEELSLREKAESGELSTLDKALIGIAIAIPVLMALRYGAGGFLASAGKGLEGYAGSIEKKEKADSERNVKSAKRAGEIQDERLKLNEKDIEINKKLIDSIPDKAAREFIRNRKVKQIGDRIGISTGDEKDALWLDGNQLETSEEGIKEARKNLSDAKEKIGMMNKGNQVVNDVLDILNAMPEDTGAWDAIKSNWGWFTSAGGNLPFALTKPLIIDVKDQDGNIRKVNAFEILKQKTAALQDVYNKINLGRAALTSNVVDHWGAILGDPKDMSEWMTGQDLATVKDKTKSLKDFLNQGATDQLVGAGFLREPLEAKYPSKTDKPLKAQDSVINKIRNEPEAYRSKVK